jgi:hypothetical protein
VEAASIKAREDDQERNILSGASKSLWKVQGQRISRKSEQENSCRRKAGSQATVPITEEVRQHIDSE